MSRHFALHGRDDLARVAGDHQNNKPLKTLRLRKEVLEVLTTDQLDGHPPDAPVLSAAPASGTSRRERGSPPGASAPYSDCCFLTRGGYESAAETVAAVTA